MVTNQRCDRLVEVEIRANLRVWDLDWVVHLDSRQTAVDRQVDAGDVAALVRGKEQSCSCVCHRNWLLRLNFDGLTMRALIGTPRKTLLKDAEEAADLVLQPRRGNLEC